MSCHVLSCHVMSCHVMSCHVMSCHVMSCHVASSCSRILLPNLPSEPSKFFCDGGGVAATRFSKPWLWRESGSERRSRCGGRPSLPSSQAGRSPLSSSALLCLTFLPAASRLALSSLPSFYAGEPRCWHLDWTISRSFAWALVTSQQLLPEDWRSLLRHHYEHGIIHLICV